MCHVTHWQNGHCDFWRENRFEQKPARKQRRTADGGRRSRWTPRSATRPTASSAGCLASTTNGAAARFAAPWTTARRRRPARRTSCRRWCCRSRSRRPFSGSATSRPPWPTTSPPSTTPSSGTLCPLPPPPRRCARAEQLARSCSPALRPASQGSPQQAHRGRPGGDAGTLAPARRPPPGCVSGR